MNLDFKLPYELHSSPEELLNQINNLIFLANTRDMNTKERREADQEINFLLHILETYEE